jgi:hypothetical protein
MPAATAFAHGWWCGNFKLTFLLILPTLTSATIANTFLTNRSTPRFAAAVPLKTTA